MTSAEPVINSVQMELKAAEDGGTLGHDAVAETTIRAMRVARTGIHGTACGAVLEASNGKYLLCKVLNGLRFVVQNGIVP